MVLFPKRVEMRFEKICDRGELYARNASLRRWQRNCPLVLLGKGQRGEQFRSNSVAGLSKQPRPEMIGA